jgi:DUF4097 and DUF4098 domain-containing protein YvlB
VKVHVMSGNVTVMPGTAGQVIVNADGAKERAIPKDVPAGMHRIDGGGGGLDIEEDHNVVTINTRSYSHSDNISILVPPNASLQLKTVNGRRIEVTGVSGELEVENINGQILLNNVSGSVVASSQNGSITATMDKVTGGKPMSFTTMNGKIDVTLPADTKAKLRLKTDNGAAYTDFDMKMEPNANQPTVEDARGKNGKYRIRMDRSVYGSINGGGPEYRFETMNGSIVIHKK